MLATFVIGFLFLAMAVGVLFGRDKPIKGSCGGLASENPDGSCDVCGGNQRSCKNRAMEITDRHYSSLHKAIHKG
ncbi:MAG: (Na+)-NQR maturation NqrM [Leptospiraceae bacterium]|nr:(Na+)-NQR maturation NqrM [Leptospiraceae bacterium]